MRKDLWAIEIMLIIQVYFKCAVFQSEIKLVTHCYIPLLYLRIIHLILQAANGPSIICDFQQNSSTAPEAKAKEDSEDELDFYDCPLYKTSLRARSLTSTGHTIKLFTSVQPADHWARMTSSG